MLPINSLSGALIQSATVQMQQAAEKAKQAREAQDKRKNIAAPPDQDEHQVENAEELTSIHEQKRDPNQKRKQFQHKEEEESSDDEGADGLDLTA